MNRTNIKHEGNLFFILKNNVIGCAFSVCMLLLLASPAHASSLQQLMSDFGVQQPKVSKLAPDFLLSGLNGKQRALSDFRGKLVLLHFWATWCVPCRHEMPLLYSLESEGMDDFSIVCVNVDRGDSNEVKEFMNEVTPHFHTLLDPSGEVRNHYAVRGLPTSYLIGRDGKIMGRVVGERDWSSPAMKELVQQLVEE
jgi:thiol-disulfide isomerase/thioredoxin